MGETDSLLAYTDAELVLGIVAAAGTDLDQFCLSLESALKGYRYNSSHVRFSELAESLVGDVAGEEGSREFVRLTRLMNAGNVARKRGGGDALALAAAGKINTYRTSGKDDQKEPLNRHAHILRSLKHPAEVLTLRRVYGPAFFLLGVVSSEADRRRYLRSARNCSETEVDKILRRDDHEGLDLGQRTRDTFHLADVFVALRDGASLRRFLDLVFAHPYETPTMDEYAMFLAFAASLRSADLSRQVGAVIVSSAGDVLSVGANDVPKHGGGLFWPGRGDQRDHVLGFDSNEVERGRIVDEIVDLLKPEDTPEKSWDAKAWKEQAWQRLREHNAQVLDLTEYGRPVHAEMEALLSCSRIGVSARGATLYTTTFPCHNCAKHILASGIRRVVYVEPYPKSKTAQFYSDSIKLGRVTKHDPRVAFEAFEGLGFRRFFDLLSIGPSTGYPVKRKVKGGQVREDWSAISAEVRVPLLPTSYMFRESLCAKELMSRFGKTVEAKE